jgi:L-aminopeptidase/D-esterase-like protein
MKEIEINEIENVLIGNAQDIVNATGCTVVLCERSHQLDLRLWVVVQRRGKVNC